MTAPAPPLAVPDNAIVMFCASISLVRTRKRLFALTLIATLLLTAMLPVEVPAALGV